MYAACTRKDGERMYYSHGDQIVGLCEKAVVKSSFSGPVSQWSTWKFGGQVVRLKYIKPTEPFSHLLFLSTMTDKDTKPAQFRINDGYLQVKFTNNGKQIIAYINDSAVVPGIPNSMFSFVDERGHTILHPKCEGGMWWIWMLLLVVAIIVIVIILFCTSLFRDDKEKAKEDKRKQKLSGY